MHGDDGDGDVTAISLVCDMHAKLSAAQNKYRSTKTRA